MLIAVKRNCANPAVPTPKRYIVLTYLIRLASMVGRIYRDIWEGMNDGW